MVWKKWGDRACACIREVNFSPRFIFYNHTNNEIDSQRGGFDADGKWEIIVEVWTFLYWGETLTVQTVFAQWIAGKSFSPCYLLFSSTFFRSFWWTINFCVFTFRYLSSCNFFVLKIFWVISVTKNFLTVQRLLRLKFSQKGNKK